MSTITTWKQPKFLTAVLVYPATLSGGTITWGTAVDLSQSGTKTFEAYQLNISANQVEISAADALTENYVNEKTTWTLTISEKAPLIGIGNLKGIAQVSTYMKFVAKYTIPSGTVYCDACFGIIQQSDTTMRQSPNSDSLTVRPVGEPAYQGAFSSLPATFT